MKPERLAYPNNFVVKACDTEVYSQNLDGKDFREEYDTAAVSS